MASDIKQLQMAKTESERKRKQAEQQVAELTLRLQDTEQTKGESQSKVAKLAQDLDQVSYLSCRGLRVWVLGSHKKISNLFFFFFVS
jgi:hypothetical protein